VPDYLLGPKGIRLRLVVRGAVGFFGLSRVYYPLQYLDLSSSFSCSDTRRLPPTIIPEGAIFADGTVWRGFLSGRCYSDCKASMLFACRSSRTVDATGSQQLSAVGDTFLGVLEAAAAYTTIRVIDHRPYISQYVCALLDAYTRDRTPRQQTTFACPEDVRWLGRVDRHLLEWICGAIPVDRGITKRTGWKRGNFGSIYGWPLQLNLKGI